MRVTLIYNAGAGDDGRPDAATLSTLIRKAGHEVTVHESADAGVLDEPTDLIAVAGGDGTVGRIAKKLIGRDIPMAPLPLGTANNISKTLGLTELTVEEIISGWDLSHRVLFDVGVAKGPWGSRYFVEAIGVGLFARTIPVADESKKLASLKDAPAKVSYALAMLRERLARCAPHRLELTIDGREVSDDYVLFEAMNMEFVGPNLYLAPDIRPADGLLDVVLVSTAECDQLKETLATWHAGDLAHPDLPRVRAQRIEIKWNGFQVHFDDESWPGEGDERPALSTIEITVERNAVSFLKASPG